MKNSSGNLSLFAALLATLISFQASAQAPLFGETPGSKLNNSSISQEIAGLFSLAEEIYPGLFKGASDWFNWEGYTYKYFAESGIYAGVREGNVYLLGGQFGSSIVQQGSLNGVTTQLQITRNEQGGVDTDLVIDVGDNEDASGDYTLKISGKLNTNVLGVSTQTDFSATVENIKAPNANDINEIEDAIIESLEGISQIRNLKIEIQSNTASQVRFRVEFEASMVSSGITINYGYDLIYDYTK
jgi:hypothetical protein